MCFLSVQLKGIVFLSSDSNLRRSESFVKQKRGKKSCPAKEWNLTWKYDEQIIEDESSCVRRLENREASISYNEQALLQFGYLLLVRPVLI